MLESQLAGVESSVEAVRRRVSGYDAYRAFAVTAVQSLIEVGLLGLGGDTCRRAASLDVNHNQRQLGDHGEAESF